MVKVSDIYSGKFLNVDQVTAKKLWRKTLTIIDADTIEFKDSENPNVKEKKIVVTFNETDLQLVLNKTNANILSKMYGDESDNWANHKIKLQKAKIPRGYSIQIDDTFQEDTEGKETPLTGLSKKSLQNLTKKYKAIDEACTTLLQQGFELDVGGVYTELNKMQRAGDISANELNEYKLLLNV